MLILSLTSFPKRMSTLNQVIDSILMNTYLPDLIVLNLHIKDFPNKENELPENLKNILSKKIFEINWCNENSKSFMKLLPTLEHYGFDNDIITIDDDVWASIVRPLGYDAGIRTMERTVDGIVRKVAKLMVEGKGQQFHITSQNIKQYLPQ